MAGKVTAVRNQHLDDTLHRILMGLRVGGPRNPNERSLARVLWGLCRPLFRWFSEREPRITLDYLCDEDMAPLRKFFSSEELSAIECGLKKVARSHRPQLILQGPADTPDARVAIEIAKGANRCYIVELASAERREGERWVNVPLRVVAPSDTFAREFHSAHELIRDARTSFLHVRFRSRALGVAAASSMFFWCDETTPGLSLLPDRISLRIHELPFGTRHSINMKQESPDRVRVVVSFDPPLSPGQIADFTVRLRRANAKAFTFEEVRARRTAGTYCHAVDLVPACESGLLTPVKRFHALTVLPRGYEITEPSAVVHDLLGSVVLTDESRRIRDIGSFEAGRWHGRWCLRLRVPDARAGALYLTFFRPPLAQTLHPALTSPSAPATDPTPSALEQPATMAKGAPRKKRVSSSRSASTRSHKHRR
jgi:hypothetical protein